MCPRYTRDPAGRGSGWCEGCGMLMETGNTSVVARVFATESSVRGEDAVRPDNSVLSPTTRQQGM